MNMLAVNWGEIASIVGVIATVTTVFLVPFSKWYAKKKKKKEEDAEQLKKDRQQQKAMYEEISVLSKEVKKNGNTLNNFLSDYDDFTTQNLKYMINDAFFSYPTIHEIPDEILINACECCDIYVNKKNKNHEIRPKCLLLWEERERRAVHREVNHE